MHRRKFLHQTALTALAFTQSLSSIKAEPLFRPEDGFLQGDHKIMIAEIEKLLPSLLKKFNVPGFSIALIRDGRNVWSKGFGVSDVKSRKPVNADTVFEVASISKTVFAYAIMRLCQDREMALDAPLVTYWSQLPMAMGLQNDPRSLQITARHILSHQSGLQDWRTSETPLKFHFDPGKGFMYSGEGYYYLQAILTHLRGKTDETKCGQYEAGHKVCASDIGHYLEKRVVFPMDMRSSGYVPVEKIQRNYALPHDVNGKVISKSPQSDIDLARYAAAGGLLSTVNDYARFIIAHFAPAENDPYRLNKESLQEMHRPQVKLPADQQIDGASAWALGWAVQERPDGNVLVHSGGQSGYRSLAMMSTKHRSGFVMLSNSDNGGNVLYDRDLDKILTSLWS